MKEIEEAFEAIYYERRGRNFLKISLIIIGVGVGVYFLSLIFSKDSFFALNRLEAKVEFLQKEIDRLKKENAKLQKKIFELFEVNPNETTFNSYSY